MSDFVKYSIWFVCLVLLQEFLFNNIQFIHFLSPYIYIFLILILPLNVHPTYIMLVAFALGLSVDTVSSGVMGAHAAACTLTAYCRNFVIKISIPKSEYENQATATAMHIKLSSFTLYAFILVFLHHTALFLLEIFSLQNFIFTLLRVIVSSIISIIFIILIKLLFAGKKEHNALGVSKK